MLNNKTIPNELTANFSKIEVRAKIIELYGNVNTLYSGENEDGERVTLSVDTETGITLETFQHNGWVRVNYYDKYGEIEGETFKGRWR